MRILYTILLLLVTSSGMAIRSGPSERDSLTFERFIQDTKSKSMLPINKLFVETALYFLDVPYVASTLDGHVDERLVVNLSQFDCTTFVETCMALSIVLKSDDLSFDNYKSKLKQIRYRSGQITDYSSRLHYVTDWIYDNRELNILTNITDSFGGIHEQKTINFMSTNSDKYLILKNSLVQRDKIREIESVINKRNMYNYLPKDEISRVSSQFKDGDIVVFATSADGLDYSHIGIAYHSDGYLKFIHASTKNMKVIIEPTSLSEYCRASKRCTGVTILRLNDLVNN